MIFMKPRTIILVGFGLVIMDLLLQISSCLRIVMYVSLFLIGRHFMVLIGIVPCLSDADDLEQVEVISTENPLQELDFIQLQRTISLLSTSDSMGVDLYIRTLEFVHQKLS